MDDPSFNCVGETTSKIMKRRFTALETCNCESTIKLQGLCCLSMYLSLFACGYFLIQGKYSKFIEVPDDEFTSWLDTLFDCEGFNGLMENQRSEIRRQFNVRLVGTY